MTLTHFKYNVKESSENLVYSRRYQDQRENKVFITDVAQISMFSSKNLNWEHEVAQKELQQACHNLFLGTFAVGQYKMQNIYKFYHGIHSIILY